MKCEESKRRILLVDDDPDIVWGLGRVLARSGYTVTTCGDGAEAVGLLTQREFDAVITDVQMPEVNGLALTEWINQNRPRTRVVVMTAFGSATVQEIAHRNGVTLYLEKPVDPDLLLRVLGQRGRADSFSGVVEDIDLFDYVQLLLVTNRRAVLEVVSSDGLRGRMYIDGGRVRHAESQELEGEEAFFCCLKFHGGRFASVPWTEPARDTITRKGEYLLMEAARLKDESARAGMGRPPSMVPPADLDLGEMNWDLPDDPTPDQRGGSEK